MPSDMIDLRIRIYTPGGAAGGILPVMGIEWTAPLGQVPTLNLDISQAVAGELPELMELAVEAWDGDEWKEPKNARFFSLKRSGDDLDATAMTKVTCVSLVSYLLSKAELTNAAGEDRIHTGTVGGILETAINEAKARGWAPYLTFQGNATHDAAGQVWNVDAQIDMAFKDGTGLLQLLQDLSDQGTLEYSTDRRTLSVFNSNTGEDLSYGDARVTVGANAAELPHEQTTEDLVTHVIVRGDTATWTFPVPGANTSLGRLEIAIAAGGVTSEDQARKFAEAYSVFAAGPRNQYTVTEEAGSMDSWPLADYRVGDWINARRPNGWERMRVVELQFRKGETLAVDITLADLLTDRAAKQARRIAALGGRLAGNGTFKMGGGSSGSDGGSIPWNPGSGSGSGTNPGWEWGSEGRDPGTVPSTAGGFTVTERQSLADPGFVQPICQNEGNLVFGATSQTFGGIREYSTAQMVRHAGGFDIGSVDLWSGYLQSGTLMDWHQAKNNALGADIMGGMMASSTITIPPSDIITTEGVLQYYVRSVRVVTGGQLFTVGGWLYFPIVLEVQWGVNDAYNYPVYVKTSVSFVKARVESYTVIGDFSVVAGATIGGAATQVNATRSGSQVALSVWNGSATKFYSAEFNGATGDMGADHWYALPSGEGAYASPLTFAKSTSGEGISAFNTWGELELSNIIKPRTGETAWVPRQGTRELGGTTVDGKVVTLTKYGGTIGAAMLNEQGSWTPYEGFNTYTSLTSLFSYDGYVYGFTGQTGQTPVSAKFTPITPPPA